MIIKEASKEEINQATKIATKLDRWFTLEGIKNMRIDLKINTVIVAVDKKKVTGFVCYSSHEGMIKLLWMAVDKDRQDRGVGTKLINFLVNLAKKVGMRGIEVKTLTDKDNYQPYKLTRNFYYKNAFKKIRYEKATVKGWNDQIIMEKIL